MSASKINPNTWQGEERDGGYIARNKKPTSTNSPHWRGKLYLVGVGWFWVSAWEQGSRSDPILALRVQEMTDEHATKFCKPKEQTRGKHLSTGHQKGQDNEPSGGSGIPF